MDLRTAELAQFGHWQLPFAKVMNMNVCAPPEYQPK